MPEPSQLLELGRAAVEAALRTGASEAEAYLVDSTSAETMFTSKVESFRVSSSMGLGVRAVVGKKLGMASTSRLSLDNVRRTAEKTVRIAKASKEDEHWHSLPSEFGRSSVPGLFDKETADLSPDVLVGCVEELADAVEALRRNVKPSRGMLKAGRSLVGIVNCYGQEISRAETGAFVWVKVSAEEVGRSATASESAYARALSAIDFGKLGSEAAERALDFLKAGKLPTRKMDVVVRGKVMASILATMFSGTLTADAVHEGRSPWADKLGQEVASESFTLMDDGTLPGGFRSRELDDEGLPTRKTVLVDKGVLKSFLYDDYWAKREGVTSTGNAWRAGYGSRPQPAPNCLILQPGDWRFGELLADTREGLYVVETIGEWLSDPVRGFLNANVTHGYLIEGGELTRPVSGVMISSRFFEAMRGPMDAFCRELEEYEGYYAPAVRIRSVVASGK